MAHDHLSRPGPANLDRDLAADALAGHHRPRRGPQGRADWRGRRKERAASRLKQEATAAKG